METDRANVYVRGRIDARGLGHAAHGVGKPYMKYLVEGIGLSTPTYSVVFQKKLDEGWVGSIFPESYFASLAQIGRG